MPTPNWSAKFWITVVPVFITVIGSIATAWITTNAKLDVRGKDVDSIKETLSNIRFDKNTTKGISLIEINEVMIQWGVAESEPHKYKTQELSPDFEGIPSVTVSADSADQNDIYCSIANVRSSSFQFLVRTPKGTYGEKKNVYWTAIGLKHK